MKVPRATKVPLDMSQLRDILKIYQDSIESMPNSKAEKEFWNKVSKMEKEDQMYMIWERFKRDAHTPGIQEYKKSSGTYMSEVKKVKTEPAVNVFKKITDTLFDPLRLWQEQKERANAKKKKEKKKEEEKKGPTPVI